MALDVTVLGNDGEPLPGALVAYMGTAYTAEALPAEAVVDQRNRRFVPHISLVAPGAAVSFPNSDDTRHHVYSFSEGNAFEIKLYRSNDAPPVIFETPGVVTLGCNIHDNMKAYVVVANGRPQALADSDGLARLPWLPSGVPVTLTIWHPQLGESMAFQLKAQETTQGRVSLTLPVAWTDPQQVKSVSELESLLKRFSRDAK
ncbi:methylamine utilization protein [Chromatocurvus halotolerans]|uniref:Plastocyanin n=1 Tax=Chromatocurvus halotolerans TaxID=1132028 RepID=A0A4R2KS41_9GAMM|nr:methylamine utilization protein [Chromatocurvus halotolerans]TCO75602.1 plastocyanin [Chromatocurvus halotolerans]